MRKGFTLIELMIVIAIIAIIAAIAIPNLLESRVTANEAAASASLKSGIFPAQTQFQGGGYLDLDGDNVGEFGTLRMLSGLEPTNRFATGSIKTLTGPLAAAQSWAGASTTAAPSMGAASNYKFAAFTPADTDTTEVTLVMRVDDAASVAAPALAAATNSANNGERLWFVAAAPSDWGSSGRRIFTLAGDGQVRSTSLNALVSNIYGGGGSTSGPANGTPATGAVLGLMCGTYWAAATVGAVTTAAMSVTVMDGNPTTNANFPVYTK